MEIDPRWHVTSFVDVPAQLERDDFSVSEIVLFLLHHFRLPISTTSTAQSNAQRTRLLVLVGLPEGASAGPSVDAIADLS